MSSDQTNQNADGAGKKVGEGIGGIFQAVGGAGEALRGNINSFLDNAGEGLTGNKASDAAHGSADYEKGGHGAVAQQGADDFKEGLNKVQGKST